MLKLEKLNESYYEISGDTDILNQIFNFLKVRREGAEFDPLVKRGFRSPFDFFCKKTKTSILVFAGHLALLKNSKFQQYLNIPDSPPVELPNGVDEYIENIKSKLGFSPYDFQIRMFKDCISQKKLICKAATGSGKSLTISMICDWFREHGLKGVLLVPNINLLTQFKSDIQSYHLDDLYNATETLGGGTTASFNKPLLISTWQSLSQHKEFKFDYVICDELHRFASPETSAIIEAAKQTKIRLGFTGTLPDNPSARMTLLGLFGMPKTYIRASELIARGLGTPVKINSVILDSGPKKFELRKIKNFQAILKHIKEDSERNAIIEKLAVKLKTKSENTLVLFSHTEHGKTIFRDIMALLYPDVKVENKDITGKKSFEFQLKYNVFFINGEDDSKTREKTRKILEECSGAILVSNFQLLSTGVNIKRLHNMILASPLKSYTTITQSIGRGMRLHPSKKVFTVYDFIDNLGIRKYSGVFYKQYLHRKQTSYEPEGYPITETFLNYGPEL